jgi:hypothetical protein
MSTTADIYTHTFAESEREAALAVERAVYGEPVRELCADAYNKAAARIC